MADTAFIEQLRQNLPRLLQEHPEVRHELWGMMLEAFPSRQEFLVLLEEMRAMRQDMNQRFETMRQDMNQRFETIIADLQDQKRQLRETNLHLSALGSRVGFGLEHIVQEVVEEFAGQTFPFADRLVLRDEAGEVYGVAGAAVEFDLYAHNGVAYLVEVKSHVRPGDVLMFYRKVRFAEGQLGRPVKPLIIALSMESQAERTMRQLGILYRVRATMDH